ncbi:MAG TPA: hypothetical protein ENK54_06030, partial [Thiotrichales bacterium]|nr:hypothetical protein [Thiotrichales bacterium]
MLGADRAMGAAAGARRPGGDARRGFWHRRGRPAAPRWWSAASTARGERSMNTATVELGWLHLLAATGLVLAAGLLSLLLRLGVGWRLALVSLRTVVQLGLLGLVLERVFALDRAVLVVGLLGVMTIFAAREAVARTRHRYPGVYWDAWMAISTAALLVGSVVTQVVVGAEPWFAPRYVIPLVGMILGNSLTGISLCLDRFLE